MTPHRPGAPGISLRPDKVLRLPRRGPAGYTASMARASTDPTILRVAQREIPLLVSRNKRARRITLRLDGLSGDVRLVLPQRMALREGLEFATQ